MQSFFLAGRYPTVVDVIEKSVSRNTALVSKPAIAASNYFIMELLQTLCVRSATVVLLEISLNSRTLERFANYGTECRRTTARTVISFHYRILCPVAHDISHQIVVIAQLLYCPIMRRKEKRVGVMSDPKRPAQVDSSVRSLFVEIGQGRSSSRAQKGGIMNLRQEILPCQK
jgi:hypothetical protein